MRIRRHFTVEGHSPYEGIAFRNAASEIRNPDGSIVFSHSDIEVPEGWSQLGFPEIDANGDALYYRNLKNIPGRRDDGRI